MNYKYLGKYHHIYRLSIGGDLKAHVEKFPIVYANKHYIYFTVPGSYQPELATLNPENIFDRGNVYTSFDQKTTDLIKKQVGARVSGRLTGYSGISNYYFLLDDPTELKTFANELSEKDLRTAYLRSEISRKMQSLEELNSSVRTKKAELEVLQETLKRWEESNAAGY